MWPSCILTPHKGGKGGSACKRRLQTRTDPSCLDTTEKGEPAGSTIRTNHWEVERSEPSALWCKGPRKTNKKQLIITPSFHTLLHILIWICPSASLRTRCVLLEEQALSNNLGIPGHMKLTLLCKIGAEDNSGTVFVACVGC